MAQSTTVDPTGLSQTRQAMRHEATPLADGGYRAIINAILAQVEATIDRWLQDDLIDIDTHRTGGLLELCFLDGSKIVLNAQPPLHELWMAARRGGYHYRHAAGRWIDREGNEFFEALSSCASEQAGLPLRFAPQG